jgi:phosphoribosylpyrophosphate synthetase
MDYHYFFDTKIRDNLELYFKFKNKNDFHFNNNEKYLFKESINNYLKEYIKESELLIVPETGNQFLLEIVNELGVDVHVLLKNDKESICKLLFEQNMMKDERKKILSIVNDMDVVKIASIPGNQRKRFVNCLFKKFETNKKVVFIDDSIFSGYTFFAARNAIIGNVLENIVFFSK